VDSVKLLEILDRVAGELGKTQAVLLQVNAGLDPAKSGVEPDGLREACSRPRLRARTSSWRG
jgi:uncharacterized pyridoxal phosphate-containing UPF0001 family protein